MTREYFYEIAYFESAIKNDPDDGFTVEVYYTENSKIEFHQRYFKSEFQKQKYIHIMGELEKDHLVLETLGISRDELLERGLINE